MNQPKDNEQCSLCKCYNNRSISIDTVIIEDGNILLIQRDTNPFIKPWDLPGGHVEWNESVEEMLEK